MSNNQFTQTRRTRGHQRLVQPDDVAQHPQRSHFQAPPATAHNLHWVVPQSLLPPPLEQSAFYNDGSQWHGQQHQYHTLHPVAQPLPQQVTQPDYDSYQHTGHHIPQPAASPQLVYYPHAQPQQQERLHHILRPHSFPANRQRFDSPNLNRQAQHHAPILPQLQFQHPPPRAQNTGAYPGQSEGSGRGDVDGWLDNVQPNDNKERRGGNRGGRRRRHGARGGSMLRNRGEITDSGLGGSHMDLGGEGGDGQPGGSVRAHELGGNRGKITRQTRDRDQFPNSAEPEAIPVTTQFQGAHDFKISGNTQFTNISKITGNLNTVNNYGGTHGLENLKEFVSFAALHNSAEQDRSRRCHPGTRENVLRRLRHWIDNPNPSDRIFWLHGPAGAGKSAIAQTIAHAYKRGEVAATFFFYRSDAYRNDGNRLFTTIAWQLAFSIPAVKDHIVEALDKLPHLPRTDVETQFEELVSNPTKDVTSQMPQLAPIVIIDGVDECSDEDLQRRFLTVIGDAVKDLCVPLRFLIVSRPEVLIEETLKGFKDITISIDLAKLDDSNHDIHKYLEDKFSEIASNRGLNPTWPGQGIIKEIVFKSSGNFIFASVVIRFINDEDNDPEFLLKIVRNLTPRGSMSPFALLDELFLEILRRQRDQDFLKTFLALLVGRIFIEQDNLHEDDATLMNVSEKVLHIKLRKMRSLLKFEPFIDFHHKSFLDFLQDPTRSGEYHVSKEGGLKRYLELIVDLVVRHISIAIEQSDCDFSDETCHPSSGFRFIVRPYPPKIVLPVEDWQDALKPLLDLQDQLLNTSKPQSCRVTQVMRDLLLHLVFLQGKSQPITVPQAPESNKNETVTERSRALVTEKNTPENDLDSCLSALLFRLQKTDSMMAVDKAIIHCMSSVLAFDYIEIVARVRSISDAQKLVDLIDLLTNNESFLSQCGQDVVRKAACLASEIFARVPLLPQSLFLNKPGRYIREPISDLFELECQSAFISKILDHNYIVPILEIFDGSNQLRIVSGKANEQNESVHTWLGRSSLNLATRIRVILEIARTIRYIHSMDVVLYSDYIRFKRFFLNSNLHAKFKFIGLFAWWAREASIYGHESTRLTNCTYESNISAFARLFHEACFDGYNENLANCLVSDAMQLIERCRAKDPKSQPTMEDVVKEMETWDLT